MRVKREEALAKRVEAFAADHEEEGGYEEKRLEEEGLKDDEAELTDQTDTDGESDVAEEDDGGEGGDYESDEEERATQKVVKVPLYFMHSVLYVSSKI